jgi:hypothetical protein
MEIIAPEILADLRGLSVGLCLTGLILGLALWLLGWRRYRFWVVLAITCLGGAYGLYEAPALRATPAVAGTLLALSAGVLALSLARVFAFGVAGCSALLAVGALVPSWDQPLVSFTAGGLLGVLLFRLWVMAVTSVSGTLLMAYSGLCLAERLTKLDGAGFAEKHVQLLNWLCVGLAGAGLVVQLLMSRGMGAAKKSAGPDKARPGDKPKADGAGPPRRTLWSWPPFRKAG